MTTRILIVDDEPLVLQSLSRLLGKAGYELLKASDLNSTVEILSKEKPDLLLADIYLKDETCMSLIKSVRTSSEYKRLPIICISASIDFEDRVEVLESGADDIIAKPFHSKELLARITALLRRAGPNYKEGDIRKSQLHLDYNRKDLKTDGGYLGLTVKQFALVDCLWQMKDNFISYEKIITDVWEGTAISQKTLETHVSNLRKKLSSIDINIENKFGVGYRLSPSKM